MSPCIQCSVKSCPALSTAQPTCHHQLSDKYQHVSLYGSQEATESSGLPGGSVAQKELVSAEQFIQWSVLRPGISSCGVRRRVFLRPFFSSVTGRSRARPLVNARRLRMFMLAGDMNSNNIFLQRPNCRPTIGRCKKSCRQVSHLLQ